ncbi:MAG: hypothetical protein EA383_14210 [Spirochaetaceae bacterium]|nr:MAG: hypothetical protein EA383_14210 [Spirochaetaceae bacterium]
MKQLGIRSAFFGVVVSILILNITGCDLFGLEDDTGAITAITPGMGLRYLGETTPLAELYVEEVGSNIYPESDVTVFSLTLAAEGFEFDALTGERSSERYIVLELAVANEELMAGTYEYSDQSPEVIAGTFGGIMSSYIVRDPTSTRFSDSDFIFDGSVTIQIEGDAYTVSGMVEVVGDDIAQASFSYQGSITERIED